MPTDPNLLSVVIPAYNEEDRIVRCLESLAAQRTRRPFEVIVVDNGSTDGTAAAARRFWERLAIRVLREPRKGRGAARRLGWEAARGALVFSTDADAVLPPDWLERGARALLADPGVAAVTGPALIDDCTAITNALHNVGLNLWRRCSSAVLLGRTYVRGANFAARKSAYEAAGGFDALADAQEDMDLSFRLEEYGRILFVPRMSVIVSGRRFRDGFLRGFADYPRAFIERFVLGRRRVLLMDVR